MRIGLELRLVVLETSGVIEIDFTGDEVLVEAIRALRDRRTELAMARLESVRAQQALRRFGAPAELGEGHLFQTVEEAVRALKPVTGPFAAERSSSPDRSATSRGPGGARP